MHDDMRDEDEAIRVIAVTTDDDGYLETEEVIALRRATASAYAMLKAVLGASAVGFLVVIGDEMRFAVMVDEALDKPARRIALSAMLVAGPMRYKAWCRHTLGLHGYSDVMLTALGLCACSDRTSTQPIAH